MIHQHKFIQDTYKAATAICYGCGINNPKGLHLKTYWDGTVGHCEFMPYPEHTAFPNYVYGGLIASIIDCHSIGTAIAASYDAAGREAGTDPEITCVTGNLNISYKKPTPTGYLLKLGSRIKELGEKKVIVVTELFANEELRVVGETIAIRVPSRSFTKED
jgi:acyl-coenzyme A thioesterase PaaI-like protein